MHNRNQSASHLSTMFAGKVNNIRDMTKPESKVRGCRSNLYILNCMLTFSKMNQRPNYIMIGQTESGIMRYEVGRKNEPGLMKHEM